VEVSADRRTIEKVQGPVQFATSIGLGLQRAKNLLPDAGVLPAAKPRVHRLPRAEPRRQVAPGGTGGEPSQNGVDDQSMVVGGPTPTSPLLRWEQRLEPRPLGIAQFVAFHPTEDTPFCRQNQLKALVRMLFRQDTGDALSNSTSLLPGVTGVRLGDRGR
jgi:hypothetical protein